MNLMNISPEEKRRIEDLADLQSVRNADLTEREQDEVAIATARISLFLAALSRRVTGRVMDNLIDAHHLFNELRPL